MEQTDSFQDMCRYIDFNAQHCEALRDLAPLMEPEFPRLVEDFYRAIEADEKAVRVFVGGRAQIERQKVSLTRWLHELFGGTYDQHYADRRTRIGMAHVRIGLDIRYMLTAMNTLRSGFHRYVSGAGPAVKDSSLAHDAIDKICDLELAIMLETYSEHYTEQIRSRERLATVGKVSGFVAQELRNPLSVMGTSLKLLLQSVERENEEGITKHVERLKQQLGLSSHIISNLLELTRSQMPRRSTVGLRGLLDSALQSLPEQGILIDTELASGTENVNVDPGQVKHLLMNLLLHCVNALSAVENPMIRLTGRPERGGLLLTVEDNGEGLPEALTRPVFDAFGGPQSAGSGLALCQNIVEKHGGQLTVGISGQGGARFEIWLAAACSPDPAWVGQGAD